MRFAKTDLTVSQQDIQVMYPETKGDYPIFYLFAHEKHSPERMEELLTDEPLVLAFISVADWHDAMTPWPGDSLFKNQPDFGGQADQFIASVDDIIAEMEDKLRAQEITVSSRHAVGFSLSAIFSLYMVSKRSDFKSVIAVSPSAWYEGIVRYFKETPMPSSVAWIYLSLGEEEADNQNERISSVQDRTDALESIFMGQDIHVLSTNDTGDHFDQMHTRMADGIRWTLEQLNPPDQSNS